MNGTYWNNTSICTGRDYFWLQCIVQDSCEMFVGMTRCWPMRGPGLHDRPIRGEARLRVLPGPGEVRWPSLDMGALFAGLDFGPFWILSSNSFIWLYQRWNDIACWLLTITFLPFNGEVTVFVCVHCCIRACLHVPGLPVPPVLGWGWFWPQSVGGGQMFHTEPVVTCH